MAASALMAGALGLSARSRGDRLRPKPSWRGWGPGPAGGLFARGCRDRRACLLGVWLRPRLRLPTAYGPGYYRAGYYGRPNAYDYGYDEPYRWGGGVHQNELLYAARFSTATATVASFVPPTHITAEPIPSRGTVGIITIGERLAHHHEWTVL